MGREITSDERLDEGAFQHKLVSFSKEGGILVVVPLFDIGYLFFNGAIALQKIVAFERVEANFRDVVNLGLSGRILH